MSIEKLIFSNLLYNKDYGRKTIPFLHGEYFHDQNEKAVFNLIDTYVKKYNSFPSKEALVIELSNAGSMSDDFFKQTKEIVEKLDHDEKTDL